MKWTSVKWVEPPDEEDNPFDVNGDGEINEVDEATLAKVPESVCWVPLHPPCPANVLLADADGLPGQDPHSRPDKPMEYNPVSRWCEAETDDPAVVAMCLEVHQEKGEALRGPTYPTGIEGYVNERETVNGTESCKIEYPNGCPPGLFRISDDTCRGYQRRPWECTDEGPVEYRPGNLYLTCYRDPATGGDPASGDPAPCKQKAPLSAAVCKQYVGSDFTPNPGQKPYKCKDYRALYREKAGKQPARFDQRVDFKRWRGNPYWCSYTSMYLQPECVANENAAGCSPQSEAPCLKRHDKGTPRGLHTGGCASVAITMVCVDLRAEYRQVHAGDDTDPRLPELAERLNELGCSTRVCLPFEQAPDEECERLTSGGSSGQFSLAHYIISTNKNNNAPHRLAILARALVALNWEAQRGEAFNPSRHYREAFFLAKRMYDNNSVDPTKETQNLPTIGFADFARIVKMQKDEEWPFASTATAHLAFNGPAQTAVFGRFLQEPIAGGLINDRQTTAPDCKSWRLAMLKEMEEGRQTASDNAKPPAECDASGAKCRAPEIGRIESESQHVSGRAVVNHKVTLRLSRVPTHTAEFRYIRAEQSKDPDPDRTVILSQAYVHLVGYDKESILRFRPPTDQQDNQRAHSDRDELEQDAVCSIRLKPQYTATIEELWPDVDHDEALIERLFGDKALDWWRNLADNEAEKGAASASRGFRWLDPALTPAEKQAERSRRAGMVTREVPCIPAAGGFTCSWVPARSGYFAIRGIGEWQVTTAAGFSYEYGKRNEGVETKERTIVPSPPFDSSHLWRPVLDGVLRNRALIDGDCEPDTVTKIETGSASNLQDDGDCLIMALWWAYHKDPESPMEPDDLEELLARAGLRQVGSKLQLLDVPDDNKDYPPWYEVCAEPVYDETFEVPASKDLRYTCVGRGTTVTVYSRTPTIGIVVYEVQSQRR